MIQGFTVQTGRLIPLKAPLHSLNEVIWFDLVDPTSREVGQVEAALGFEIPSREEMEEIEVSSRLYTENGAIFMTATLLTRAETEEPATPAVTFVLVADKLVTLRYDTPRAFQTFPTQAARSAVAGPSAMTLLVALLEAIVDRMADNLERVGREIDGLSKDVFDQATPGVQDSGRSGSSGGGRSRPRSTNFQRILKQVGRKGDLLGDARVSLVSLQRLSGFLAQQAMAHKAANKETRARIKTLSRDIASLIDHASFLASKITFLLDATLGMINIEQNGIIKLFSVMAVIFLPPTLVASIYGMNFAHMPELQWHLGYPLALLLMVVSAILPYKLFKRWGWL